MKVKDHKDYQPEAPENFSWATLASAELAHVAMQIASGIFMEHGLDAQRRVLTPGLREALRIIAKDADL